jgi:hypothetical protein
MSGAALIEAIDGDSAAERTVMPPTVTPRLTRPQPTGRAAKPRVDTVECPRCGRYMAKIIGRSEVVPVVYLRCDGCHMPSVAGI